MLKSRQDEARCQQVADIAKSFYQHGWLMGTSGNLSFRADLDKNQYWITQSGKDKGALSPADFLYVGPNAKPINLDAGKPSAEALLHETLYQLYPNAQAVFHVHSVHATVLSRKLAFNQTSIDLADLEMIKGLGAKTHDTSISIPVIENHQDMTVIAPQLSKRLLPDIPGFILKGHGLYAWGNSLADAKRHIEIFEFLLEVAFKELLIS